MKWAIKRVNKHIFIHNYCYFKDFKLGAMIGKNDIFLELQLDLFFIGITIRFCEDI